MSSSNQQQQQANLAAQMQFGPLLYSYQLAMAQAAAAQQASSNKGKGKGKSAKESSNLTLIYCPLQEARVPHQTMSHLTCNARWKCSDNTWRCCHKLRCRVSVVTATGRTTKTVSSFLRFFHTFFLRNFKR